MSGPDLLLAGRDFLAATSDSCGRLPTLLGDLFERAPVAIKHRWLSHYSW
jgi:hypothetical protein